MTILTTTKVVVTKPNFSPVGYHRLGSSAPRTRLGGYLFPQKQKTILPPAPVADVVLVSSSTERTMGSGLNVPVGYHRLGASYPRTRSRDYLFSKRSKKVLYISGVEAVEDDVSTVVPYYYSSLMTGSGV